MATVVEVPEAIDSSRISWAAVILGSVVALAVSTMLSVFGAAVATGMIKPGDPNSASAVTTGGFMAFWFVLSTIVGLLAGGYAAGQVLGRATEHDATIHGFGVWAVVLLATTYIGGTTLARGAGNILYYTSSAIGRVADAGEAAGYAAYATGGGAEQDLINRVESSVGSLQATPEVRNEIAQFVKSQLAKGEWDAQSRQQLASIVAKIGQMPSEQAAQRVDAGERAIQGMIERAQYAARVALKAGATAGYATFFAMLLGAAAAVLGAWRGVLPGGGERPYLRLGEHAGQRR